MSDSNKIIRMEDYAAEESKPKWIRKTGAAIHSVQHIGKIKKRILTGGLILVATTGFFYFGTSLSRLNLIHVEGVSYLTNGDVLRMTGITHEQPILSIYTEQIEETLNNHPLIKTATVSIEKINELRISIQEEEILGCILKPNELHLLTAQGEWVDRSDLSTQSCQGILFYDLDNLTDQDSLTLLTEELLKLSPEFLALIQGVYYEPDFGDVNRFSLTLKDGNIVKVNTYLMVEKLKHYSTMVSKIHQTYGDVTGTFFLDVGDRFALHPEYLKQYLEDKAAAELDESENTEN